MMFNAFMQQIPVITSANLLTMSVRTNQTQSFDPLAEIRNGFETKDFLSNNKKNITFALFF